MFYLPRLCRRPFGLRRAQEELKNSRRRRLVVLHVSSAVFPSPPVSPSPLLLFLSSRPKPNKKKRGVWGEPPTLKLSLLFSTGGFVLVSDYVLYIE